MEDTRVTSANGGRSWLKSGIHGFLRVHLVAIMAWVDLARWGFRRFWEVWVF